VGVDPLQVVAKNGRRVELRGELATMLDLGAPDLPAVASYPAADLAGVRSTSLDVGVGAQLTSVFLNSLGLPVPGAEVTANLWRGARSLQFEVRDVSERRVDVNALGMSIAQCKIRDNPATRIFLTDKPAQAFVITRALVSRSFAVYATAEGGSSVKVAVDAIENLMGKASASINWTIESTGSLSFKGVNAVTFGFAALPCTVQRDRTIVFGLEADGLSYGGTSAASEGAPIIEEDGLLDFDASAQ
jgi:hypothetical protein